MVFISSALWRGDTVHAGDINDAEAMIISYYNGTFQYQGKTYVATESAKTEAYNKLIADDVNLTYSEARSAIAQANSQIADGITRGYLVELVQPSAPEEEVPKGEDTEKEEPKDVQNGQGEQQEPVSDSDADSQQNQIIQGEQEDEEISSDTDDSKDKSDKKRKVDKQEMPITKEGNLFSIFRYGAGEQLLVKEDGTIVYAGELPFKNTGYNHSKEISLLKGMLLGVGVLLVIGIGKIFNKEKHNET